MAPRTKRCAEGREGVRQRKRETRTETRTEEAPSPPTEQRVSGRWVWVIGTLLIVAVGVAVGAGLALIVLRSKSEYVIDISEDYIDEMKERVLRSKSEYVIDLSEDYIDEMKERVLKLVEGPISASPVKAREPFDSISIGHGDLPDRDDVKVSLNREYPDHRDRRCASTPAYSFEQVKKYPKASVVMIFCNEELETLLRSVHSILNTAPRELLGEIILVDDGSAAAHLKDPLEDHIAQLPKVKLYRLPKQHGIPIARTVGIEAAQFPVFIILDSHIEMHEGWLEPLLYTIVTKENAFVMPQIDSIQRPAFTPRKGGIGCHIGIIWRLMEHAFAPIKGISPLERLQETDLKPSTSPTMSGGLFAGPRDLFFQLGGYDLEFSGWGAENLQLSFKLWMCGAKLYCAPCSRIGHVFQNAQKFVTNMEGYDNNRLRLASVWMDEFAMISYIVLRKPQMRDSTNIKILGDLSPQYELRHKLECKNFKWFLNNVNPEAAVLDISEVSHGGRIRSKNQELCWSNIIGGIQSGSPVYVADSHCVPFMYFKRTSRIAFAFEDEMAVTADGDKFYFDWNEPHKRYANIELIEKNSTIQFKSVVFDKCIGYDESTTDTPDIPKGSHKLVLVECDDPTTIWIIDEMDVSWKGHYNEWLKSKNYL